MNKQTIPIAIGTRLQELMRHIEAHFIFRFVRFSNKQPNNLNMSNKLNQITFVINDDLEDMIMMYCRDMKEISSLQDANVTKEHVKNCLNSHDGQMFTNATYYFENFGDCFSKLICMEQWYNIMSEAGQIANAYLRYCDSFLKTPDTPEDRDFTTYIIFPKLTQIFNKNDDARAQFLSFVGQIYYVGQGVQSEPFMSFKKRQTSLKKAMVQNSRNVACFTMDSGRGTVLLLEMQMMWRLRKLLIPIVNMSYVNEHIIPKILDRSRMITVHIGSLYNIFLNIKHTFGTCRTLSQFMTEYNIILN